VISVGPMSIARNWKIQSILTILSAYFYIFMEWLFFVTKPSFMSTLSFVDTLQVLWVTPIPVTVIGVIGVFLCWILTIVIRNRICQKVCFVIAQLIPASIFAFAIFLLIDNFTYTIFGFGVISTKDVWRLGYGFLMLILVVFSYRVFYHFKTRLFQPALYRKLVLIAPGMLLISVLVVFVTFSSSGLATIKDNMDITSLRNRPNILLLASDGLNAENMSVYGYHRDTTPFMRELAKNALLCENCFTNAGSSGASIASMFTGRLPTQTRVYYPPDILKGEDAYRHLPGILRRHGYRSIDISIRHYADPYDLNMRNSFDWVNFREIKENYVSEHLSSLLGQESSYFLGKMRDRITGRLFHVFGVRKMEDAFTEVVKFEKKYYRDAKRISGLLSFIDASPSPFFAHLHLLGTHGPKFRPNKRLYSVGQKQEEPWMADFYDDAILNFDYQVKGIIQGLGDRGILNNTVIVICTDHGQRRTVNVRIPLIFLFPNGEHAGYIKGNVQNLDIAPTILDYLGIKQPGWMGGLSLISSKVEPYRFIFTANRKHGHGLAVKTEDGWELDSSKIGPPFYSLGSIGVIFCHKFFKLDIEKSILTISDIKGHTSPCNEDDIPDSEEIGRLIIDHLAENNYDTSSIKTSLAKRFLH